MPWSWRTIGCGLGVGALISLAACGLVEPGWNLQVTLKNNDLLAPIHMFRSTEGFSSSNRVEAGSSRVFTIENAAVGDEPAFAVGRDGEILNTVSCRISASHEGSRAMLVTWTPSVPLADTGTLTCD